MESSKPNVVYPARFGRVRCSGVEYSLGLDPKPIHSCAIGRRAGLRLDAAGSELGPQGQGIAVAAESWWVAAGQSAAGVVQQLGRQAENETGQGCPQRQPRVWLKGRRSSWRYNRLLEGQQRPK